MRNWPTRRNITEGKSINRVLYIVCLYRLSASFFRRPARSVFGAGVVGDDGGGNQGRTREADKENIRSSCSSPSSSPRVSKYTYIENTILSLA